MFAGWSHPSCPLLQPGKLLAQALRAFVLPSASPYCAQTCLSKLSSGYWMPINEYFPSNNTTTQTSRNQYKIGWPFPGPAQSRPPRDSSRRHSSPVASQGYEIGERAESARRHCLTCYTVLSKTYKGEDGGRLYLLPLRKVRGICRLAERACLCGASAAGETPSSPGSTFCSCSSCSEADVKWGSQAGGEVLSSSGLCCLLLILSVKGICVAVDWKPYSTSIGSVL